MHELGVTFSIMDSLEKVAEQNNVKHINKVVLELGEVSTVIPQYLIDCWNWASKKRELFNDCNIVIEPLQAVSYCNNCKKKFETTKYGKTCPVCDKDDTYLICGNEFNIKEIEVYN